MIFRELVLNNEEDFSGAFFFKPHVLAEICRLRVFFYSRRSPGDIPESYRSSDFRKIVEFIQNLGVTSDQVSNIIDFDFWIWGTEKTLMSDHILSYFTAQFHNSLLSLYIMMGGIVVCIVTLIFF